MILPIQLITPQQKYHNAYTGGDAYVNGGKNATAISDRLTRLSIKTIHLQ
jgi:hypothetical protein